MKRKIGAIRANFLFLSYNNMEIVTLIIETVVELIMAEDHNKNESESESELRTNEYMAIATKNLLIHHERIKELERLVKALIGEVEAMQRGDNTGAKHINDGGYFD